MNDEWSRGLFIVSYAGIELDVLDVRDDVGRELSEFSYLNRDGANVDDQGGQARRTFWTIVFAPFREPDHLARFAAFMTVVQDGDPHTLVHPLTGSLEVRPGQVTFEAVATDRDYIVVNAEFVEYLPDPAVFEINDASPVPAGVAAVRNQVTVVDLELEEVNLTTTVTTDATELVDGWESTPDLSAREIDLQMNAVANKIADEIDRLELATDVSRQPVLSGLLQLRRVLRAAADAFIAQAPRLIKHLVRVSAPLLSIVLDIYGDGQSAELRAEQIIELNDIRDPAYILADTVLIARAPTQVSRFRAVR